ncbi:MAG: BAX inhibitor protein [Gammaproteobacteria bacterium RIFCSPHIGHO2_02_FULL_42_13]|nr:MAG: BAX inhibitor protein [Gammaproteobacteria bacterium RIFCSPHIGHO2_02_FULL_42_13]OGT69430.1 MAG: BAX inhibitor protein [Gammaproteobacteria bacterium RIFCSPLOWO2_02_FULL_42_9]HLB57720.1 Bax inhibitor-1/YccA family protein [Gammaproteobacteria bacterium]
MSFQESLVKRNTSALSANSVLRKTYALLSVTLLFSALAAAWSMVSGAAPVNPILMIIGYFALLFLTSALRKSRWGILAVFALTGLLGYTLGPILNFYINGFSNGSQMILTAFGGTGIIFFALSAYALTTKKDFSYMAGFIFAAFIVAFLMGILTFFFQSPVFMTLISGVFILISSGYILVQTSMIINGGETSYIMATVGLYVALFNIFVSLLQILSIFSGNRN